MPELPEVEIVATSLNELIKSRKIENAALFRPKLFPSLTSSQFENEFRNVRIEEITRRGKFIKIRLENDNILLVHLRMSGRFQVLSNEHDDPKFTHAVFNLDDSTRLVFSDQRHFGYMNLVAASELEDLKEIKNIAPEPFSDEFDVDYLKRILKTSRRRVKEFILDQTKVCGLGNIYASEALYDARIHPLKPANEVSAIKARRLHGAIIEVLRRSIEHGSSLRIDPLNLESRYYGGDFEGEFSVYDREKQPCPRCDNPIKRIAHGGRSSYYCAKCQRLK